MERIPGDHAHHAGYSRLPVHCAGHSSTRVHAPPLPRATHVAGRPRSQVQIRALVHVWYMRPPLHPAEAMACALLQCPVELEEVETAGQLHEVGEAGSPYAGAEGRTKERPHQPHGAGLGASGAACEREAVEAAPR